MEKVSEQMSEQVIREVMKRIGQGGKITLRQAKRLIERVEEYAGSTDFRQSLPCAAGRKPGGSSCDG